jgi:mRNA interferase RelE/StbE
MCMKTILYTVSAARALRTHANRAKVIRSKIAQYASNPASQANNVKRPTGVDALRLRVGDFRVIFSETADTVTILDIGPRGDIYE